MTHLARDLTNFRNEDQAVSSFKYKPFSQVFSNQQNNIDLIYKEGTYCGEVSHSSMRKNFPSFYVLANFGTIMSTLLTQPSSMIKTYFHCSQSYFIKLLLSIQHFLSSQPNELKNDRANVLLKYYSTYLSQTRKIEPKKYPRRYGCSPLLSFLALISFFYVTFHRHFDVRFRKKSLTNNFWLC